MDLIDNDGKKFLFDAVCRLDSIEEKLREIQREIGGIRLEIKGLISMRLLKISSDNSNPDNEHIHAKPIEFLGLLRKSRDCLAEQRIKFIGDLIQYNARELFELPKVGKVCLTDVKSRLGYYGLSLSTEINKLLV